MSAALLRRAAIAALLAALAAAAAYAAIAPLIRAQEVSAATARVLEAEARLLRRAAEIAAAAPAGPAPLIAAGRAEAVSAARGEIAAAFEGAGGALLALQARESGSGLIETTWLWRGDEAALRAALEALARDAPQTRLQRLRLRRVQGPQGRTLEADGVALRRWESAP